MTASRQTYQVRTRALFLCILLSVVLAGTAWMRYRQDESRVVLNLMLAQIVEPAGGRSPYLRMRREGGGIDPAASLLHQWPEASTVIAKADPHALVTARGMIAILGLGVMTMISILFMLKPNSEGHEQITVRGPRLVDLTRTRKRLVLRFYRWWRFHFWVPDTCLRLGDVPLAPYDEVQHILAVGGTGAGKSTAIRRLLIDIKARRPNAKAVVLDLGGELHRRFGRPQDLLLNPFDVARSVRWSIFHQISRSTADQDTARLAAGLMPGGGSLQNSEWSAFARPVLASVLERLYERGGNANELSSVGDQEKMKSLLAGRAEAAVLNSGSPGSSGSVIFMVADAIQKLASVECEFEKCKGQPFSIRQWVHDPAPGVLWVTFNESQRASLKFFHSLFVSELSKAALELQPSMRRRLFIVADELGSLGRIDGLRDLLEKGRKYGVGVIACLQSLAQLDQSYGRDEARILIDNFRNWLILNTPGSESAQYFSKAIGSVEIERTEMSQSTGPSGRSQSLSQRLEQKPLVLASEILTLPNLTGFVKIASKSDTIFKTKIDPVDVWGTK